MLSVCIPVKNRSKVSAGEHTLYLLPECLKSLQSCLRKNEAEIIICDYHSTDWPLEEWIKDTLRTVPVTLVRPGRSRYFSRGRARNIAARFASAPRIIFLDADTVIDRRFIDFIDSEASDDTAVFPVLFSYNDTSGTSGYWRHAGFGNACVSRSMLEKVRFPEYYYWGGEDDEFYIAISRKYNVVRQEVPGIFHQWHPADHSWKNRYGLGKYRSALYSFYTRIIKKVIGSEEKYQVTRFEPDGGHFNHNTGSLRTSGS